MTGLRIRLAAREDIPALRSLIEASVLGLQAGDYTQSQLEKALESVYGVDTALIDDGTYFLVETSALEIAGCGGWSRRKTLYGGDQFSGREDDFLNPAVDAARIRAFFVHPAWARRGIGTMLLKACEEAAHVAGFRRLEMGATLTGVGFYRAHGYQAAGAVDVPLGNGEVLSIIRMTKRLIP